jgi:hypothetical protein
MFTSPQLESRPTTSCRVIAYLSRMGDSNLSYLINACLPLPLRVSPSRTPTQQQVKASSAQKFRGRNHCAAHVTTAAAVLRNKVSATRPIELTISSISVLEDHHLFSEMPLEGVTCGAARAILKPTLPIVLPSCTLRSLGAPPCNARTTAQQNQVRPHQEQASYLQETSCIICWDLVSTHNLLEHRLGLGYLLCGCGTAACTAVTKLHLPPADAHSPGPTICSASFNNARMCLTCSKGIGTSLYRSLSTSALECKVSLTKPSKRPNAQVLLLGNHDTVT